MTEKDRSNNLKKLGPAKRKGLSVSDSSIVRTESLAADKALPLVYKPYDYGVDIVAWAAANQELIDNLLLNHGGLLYRGFELDSVERFEQLVKAASTELLEYRERSSPRSRVQGNVYTSTDYPADQTIFLHNENSYSDTWPLRIYFYCAQAASQGGETLIADVRRVFRHIEPSISQRFAQKEVMYIRNFSEKIGLPWQTVFQTCERSVVEVYCRQHRIECTWKGDGGLRTRQVRPAMVAHPLTGEMLWFNHATFFHVSTLAPEVRDALLSEFKDEDLPNQTCYGDGSPIEDDVLDHLREAYLREAETISWREGDVLALDNLLTAHGRAPFTGTRRVLVAMTLPHTRAG